MKAAAGVTPYLADVFSLVEEDLQRVEEGLDRHARAALPLIQDINHYLHDSGGKRLRPLLLLLASRLCGFQGDPAVRLSAVVELIHVATLVHDDIIDNADMRRGRPSVNAKWGNDVTVLVGDWLYMTSFHLALELRNLRILDILIDITRTMVEGELMQLEQDGDTEMSVDGQLEICYRKTAHLFAGCGQLGSILGQTGPEEERSLQAYGRCVGMAFQLIDDLLDYASDEGTLGKPVLKDLQEGKVTLPIIYLMQRATEPEKETIREIVRSRDFSSRNRGRIIALVRAYKTLEDVRTLAEDYCRQAKQELETFPDSIYREALLRFPDYLLSREK